MNREDMQRLNTLLATYRDHIGWGTKDKQLLDAVNLVQQHVAVSLDLSRKNTER